MQRTIILACFFVLVTIGGPNCLAQQYPFVHYSPKDGLISNEIRNIYQDSKGRLYFMSPNGLSVYDGSRFINYTSKNGLAFDIINCVMEMGDDSIWIIPNASTINCLVNGKLKTLNLKESNIPIINKLIKDENGAIYAATDQGLYQVDNGQFTRLPFIDTSGRDVNSYISNLLPIGNYFLIQRDNANLTEGIDVLYLYNKTTKKTTAQLSMIYAAQQAPDKRVWISTADKIMSVDSTELSKGNLVLTDLPAKFEKIKQLGRYVLQFDREGNCWLGDQAHIVIKAGTDGKITSFRRESGLSMAGINWVFQDREGITWIATQNNGVDKLVHSNFTFTENPFNIAPLNDISCNENKDQVILFSLKKATLVRNNTPPMYYHVVNAGELSQIAETHNGLFGVWKNKIYKITRSAKDLHTQVIFDDAVNNRYTNPVADKYGNLIACGRYNILALVNGKTICWKQLDFLADNAALDTQGNIWVATRSNHLIMFEPHPEDPQNYLQQKKLFSQELGDISPRSIVIDRNNCIWIGTRNHGIHVFNCENGKLLRLFSVDNKSGLSDNFVTYLAGDAANRIWVCSPAGLDVIKVINKRPVIENLTRQNGLYQSALKVVVDKTNVAWILMSNGLIKVSPESRTATGYSPKLLISMIKAGKDTMSDLATHRLSYKQNNLSFYFAAPSFFDEKQILYSYRLQGGSDDRWSEPSGNSSVSFIDLRPGNYTLGIKAIFPASRYPEQILTHEFSIAPPWWQTWWFRSIGGLLVIGLLIIGSKLYYRRKMEKQMATLARQKDIEKERTRIATDMHDDLGAGLSRIKFLSQSILNKRIGNKAIQTELEKITSFSDEMSEKMGEIVWALNEKNDTLADLVAYTRSYVVEYLATHNIQCEANTPLRLPGTFVTGEIRRNIFLSVKECLHNIVKHAGASKVWFSIQLNSSMEVIIYDNGKGIDWNNRRAFSNGIQNIERRMKDIRGTVRFSNERGTRVTLTIPFVV